MVADIRRKPSGSFIPCLFIILGTQSENPKNIRSSLLAPDLEKMTASEFFIPDQTYAYNKGKQTSIFYSCLLIWCEGAPWPRLPNWLQKFFRILSRKHDEMCSFRLNNGFRLQKTNRAARRSKQPPKKPFHHESPTHATKYSTILGVFQPPWPGVSPILHYERGEGPGDKVANFPEYRPS